MHIPEATQIAGISSSDLGKGLIKNEIEPLYLRNLENNDLEPSPAAKPNVIARRLAMGIGGLSFSDEALFTDSYLCEKSPMKIWG